MGLSIIGLKKRINVVNYDVFEDEELEMVRFYGDEKLITLLSETGTVQEDDSFITFNEEQLKHLINISESIDDGTFKRTDFSESDNYIKMYETRYGNETMLDFYKRWDRIIKGLKQVLHRLNWEEEHLVMYISA